jgi:hypothetical protein
MEKVKVLNGSKLEPINKEKKEIMAEKIDSLWGNRSVSPEKQSKYEKKKLIIKLETNGTEKRKILLKLESANSNVHQKNYNLLSELLKDFFL